MRTAIARTSVLYDKPIEQIKNVFFPLELPFNLLRCERVHTVHSDFRLHWHLKRLLHRPQPAHDMRLSFGNSLQTIAKTPYLTLTSSHHPISQWKKVSEEKAEEKAKEKAKRTKKTLKEINRI